jgi:hypothetical protein
MDEEIIAIIVGLQEQYDSIQKLKEKPGSFDGRSISIALTELDTAMLWLANARK